LRKDAQMLPLNATLSRCNRIGCNPTIVPNIRALRPRGPALGMIVRFMQSLLQALHESRLEQAKREIHRVRHLMPTQAVKIGNHTLTFLHPMSPIEVPDTPGVRKSILGCVRADPGRSNCSPD
jgi:hypothetical protein